MLVNYHMHTNTSVDSDATIMGYAKKAFELGFSEICITNHMEIADLLRGNSQFAMSAAQVDSLKEQIRDANRLYPGLTIRLGVEYNTDGKRFDDMRVFSAEHGFDYVILSTHQVNGFIIANPILKLPEHFDLKETYRQYFKEIKDSIPYADFDCLGHLDCIKRAAPMLPFEEIRNNIDDIAELLLKHQKGFELNTSGWRHGKGEGYPSYEIVRQLYEKGVRIVTIGSDCHRIDEFDQGIGAGLDVLRKAGFTEICRFKKRKPSFFSL
jgi:histidinol-phosphatase (PHP family)